MKSHTISIALVALALLLLAGVVAMKPLANTYGAAFTGSSSYLQVATTTTVGASAGRITIFSASADGSCKARVIGTKATPIVILFGDPTNGNLASTTLTGETGFVQGASTTVAYDSGIYGCGRWTAYAAASTTITVSEF